MCNQTKQPEPANVNAEYAALISYHNSIVTHRFTLLGFFVATVGIVAKDGMGMLTAFLVLVFTIALYMVEHRNRALYTQMSNRAMEIEMNYWKLNRSNAEDKGLPLFCRFRQNELPDDLKRNLTDEQKKEFEAKPKFFKKWEIPLLPASHSMGLDLLYASVAIYAIVQIIRLLIGCK